MKTYSVLIEGKPFDGTAVQILTALSQKNFFITYDNLDEFIEKSSHDIWRLYAIGINVVGKTTEEKAESMLVQLIEHNLLREANKDAVTSLDMALDKSNNVEGVYLVGWINNMMQRRLLHNYEGKTVGEKYNSAKKDFGEDILSFEFPNGEAIWVKS